MVHNLDDALGERALIVASIKMLKAKPRTSLASNPANDPDASLLVWLEETLREFDARS